MALASVSLTDTQVFGAGQNLEFLPALSWEAPIQFFVGRNGSGKSKTAGALTAMQPRDQARLVSTDRLIGVMGLQNFGYGTGLGTWEGAPLRADQAQQMRNVAQQQGLANDVFYVLRDQPAVFLRIAALFRRAFGRRLFLAEVAGLVDPIVEDSAGRTYSLLRDEGHGLRELTVLLAYTYEEGRELLVVDEPELHLHPALARFWLEQLRLECEDTGRRAVIITHSPELVHPTELSELDSIWVFSPFLPPRNLGRAVHPDSADVVAGSIRSNPRLVSGLVFSARPVLVEGPQ